MFSTSVGKVVIDRCNLCKSPIYKFTRELDSTCNKCLLEKIKKHPGNI